MKTNEFMVKALIQAYEGIYNKHGGPFGSVVVKDGKIIGVGHNCVLLNNDPTAHGEIMAIRNTGKIDLTGCDLYTTGEPCPMCLAACMWANINHIYYGCTIQDNEDIGFRDAKFDELLGGRDGMQDYMTELNRDSCLRLFDTYKEEEHKLY